MLICTVHLTVKATMECGFTLTSVRDMIVTYSQMHYTDKFSQHSLIIWPPWLNGWMFVYELSGCGFESSCSHLNFRFHACFEQGVPWHSGNYGLRIHCESRAWHDNNIQYNAKIKNIETCLRTCPSRIKTCLSRKIIRIYFQKYWR